MEEKKLNLKLHAAYFFGGMCGGSLGNIVFATMRSGIDKFMESLQQLFGDFLFPGFGISIIVLLAAAIVTKKTSFESLAAALLACWIGYMTEYDVFISLGLAALSLLLSIAFLNRS